MNYFAHGYRFVDDPYYLVGTAIPDWLGVVDRKSRVRSQAAADFVEHSDPRMAAIARGIVQHHHDDGWFHNTRAFAELSWEFTAELRDRLRPDASFRPSVLGHILVEVLLDDVLIQRDPESLGKYYQALNTIDAEFIARSVNLMATREATGLAQFIPLFSAERFLYDYADDAKLLYRLNRVMQRVKLPPLPNLLLEYLPRARLRLTSRADELMNPK
jgi:hypothetical protein